MTEALLDPVREEVRTFRHSALDLLRGESPLQRLREEVRTERQFDRALWQRLADSGWSALLVPEALGGLGLGVRHACAVASAVGEHPLPEPYVGLCVQTVAALVRLPASALRDELLADVADGGRVIALAWQERLGQLSEAECRQTRAERDGDDVLLYGDKRWVCLGDSADGWLISACDDESPGVYWLPQGTPGVRVSTEERLEGLPLARITLDGARLPAAFRLASGTPAAAAIELANDTARLAQAAELTGAARRAHEITLDYLKTRVQFGKPIGANQALQHRMVDALLQLELAESTLEQVLRELDADPDALPRLASRAKARAAHAARFVTRLAIQFHGAIGYTDEHDIGLYFKRALGGNAWLGNAAAHRLRYLCLSSPAVEHATDEDPGDVPSPDTDWNALGDEQFRRTVRAFFARHYPDALRFPPRRLRWHEVRDWYLTLSRQGWLAPAWPREHGGMALAPEKLLAFMEESEAWGVARTPDQGIINLGPVLIRYGTPEQRQTYLPRILSGEHVWCQGYSEPNAGSDLASLRTEALADGQDFVVNGQKIWTTLAQDATHIFLLVRTDKAARKQAGISFLLVDLATPGITVRPIRNIHGDEEFCEVFFDDVRVPQANLVGELNQGWTIAKALLGFERIFVGSPQQSRYALHQLRALGQTSAAFEQADFRARYAELLLDTEDLGALYERFSDFVKRGRPLPPDVSLLKIWATETYGRISDQLAESAAEAGSAYGQVDLGGVRLAPLAPLMNAIITTIYGGTNEVQRNIVAKQVLGLPA
ncbi:acyl-CoA dehydrogenase [Verticiella sediminum]|uniref:Acyl-CoA dehydrogenase n=2 Tax=Verticiella sediminum TaxID=1247510 RepID=A0A556APP8_9BURK|nr:acyl-CoA dehydrogenase [Verticiella sediminum]